MESENFNNNFITEIINSDLDKIADTIITTEHTNISPTLVRQNHARKTNSNT